MNTNEITLIGTKLASITNEAIKQYTIWHFTNALVFETLGIVLLFLSIRWLKRLNNTEMDEDKSFWLYIFLGFLCLTATLLIAVNIVNIINPQAYAIHQLIEDVKP